MAKIKPQIYDFTLYCFRFFLNVAAAAVVVVVGDIVVAVAVGDNDDEAVDFYSRTVVHWVVVVVDVAGVADFVAGGIAAGDEIMNCSDQSTDQPQILPTEISVFVPFERLSKEQKCG